MADLKGYALCRRPRCGFGWPEDGFWVVWGWFLGDLGTILEGEPWRPVGRDWRALEASGEAWGRPEARTLRMSRAVCSILGARDGKDNGRNANPVRFGPPKYLGP